MHDLDAAHGVFVDRKGVDHAYGVTLPELLEFLDDLAVEVRALESQHQQLHWSDCHIRSFSRRLRPDCRFRSDS